MRFGLQKWINSGLNTSKINLIISLNLFFHKVERKLLNLPPLLQLNPRQLVPIAQLPHGQAPETVTDFDC